jgi:hypothetical protein
VAGVAVRAAAVVVKADKAETEKSAVRGLSGGMVKDELLPSAVARLSARLQALLLCPE